MNRPRDAGRESRVQATGLRLFLLKKDSMAVRILATLLYGVI